MPAFGTMRKSPHSQSMSAFGGKADIVSDPTLISTPRYTHLLCSVGRGVRKDQFRKLQKFCELSCGSADVREF